MFIIENLADRLEITVITVMKFKYGWAAVASIALVFVRLHFRQNSIVYWLLKVLLNAEKCTGRSATPHVNSNGISDRTEKPCYLWK